MKILGLGRRRTRSDGADTSFNTREGSYMSRSTRTGGFEIPRESDFQTGEEDTILDQSIYTATDFTHNSHLEKSTVISTATTVKQSSGKVLQRKQLQQRPPPVLDTGDIEPRLERYQQNRANGYRNSPTMVTPTNTAAVASSPPSTTTTIERSTPWGCTRVTPRTERSSSPEFFSPDIFQGMDTFSSPDTPKMSNQQSISKVEPVADRSTAYRFEFADMEKPARRIRRADDENVSVHSFSFSETEEEIGFELDDPYPIVHAAASEDRDEESSSSELSVDVSARVQVSDSHLLDGQSSPGALRLTTDCLKEHEKKSFQQARRQPARHSDEFEAYRKEHETRKWYRQRLKEREQKLLEETNRMQQSQFKAQNMSSNKAGCALPLPFRPEEGVADLSLAPLVSMQHLQTSPIVSSQKKRTFPLFRRKGKQSAEEILERERQRARETQKLEQLRIQQEKQRIARKKREYLEQQRLKEMTGGVLVQSDSLDTQHLTTATTTTMSTLSTATPVLPHCVLCLEDFRTHIATPCMHFSFCARCVKRLKSADKRICPVCRTPDVTYEAVAI